MVEGLVHELSANSSLLLIALLGRSTSLEQAFVILLDNAVKFHRPGVRPVVAVECVDRGDAWELAVT